MWQNKSDSRDCLGDRTKDIKRKPKTGWDHSYRGRSALTTQECVSCRLFNKSCLHELSWYVILIFFYKTRMEEKEPHLTIWCHASDVRLTAGLAQTSAGDFWLFSLFLSLCLNFNPQYALCTRIVFFSTGRTVCWELELGACCNKSAPLNDKLVFLG